MKLFPSRKSAEGDPKTDNVVSNEVAVAQLGSPAVKNQVS